MTFSQVVGVTLSKLRLWAGQLALHIQGGCSSLRRVRSQPRPEVAMQSNVAFGAEASVLSAGQISSVSMLPK